MTHDHWFAFTRRRHLFAVAVMTLALCSRAEAQQLQLYRNAPATQTERYREFTTRVVRHVQEVLTAQGRKCRLTEQSERSLAQPISATVAAEGLLPRAWARLECPALSEDEGRDSVQIGIDFLGEAEGAERPIVLQRRGGTVLATDTGGDLVLYADAPPQGQGPRARVSIKFQDRRWRDVAQALDANLLVEAAREWVALPRPEAFPAPEPKTCVGTAEERDAAEAQVLKRVLADYFDPPKYLVRETLQVGLTLKERRRQEFLKNAPDLRPSLFADLARVAKEGGHPPLPEGVREISNARHDEIFEPEGGRSYRVSWQEFRKLYPGVVGTLEISRVAFSNDMKQAAIYYGWKRDMLVGQGYVVILEKTDSGAWEVIYSGTAWVT